MDKTFDPTKPVRTRGGKPARILCTDRHYEGQRHAPILALVSEKNGENPSWHHSDGTAFGAGQVRPSSRDLVNYDPFEITDEEAELMVNFFVRKGYFVHASVPNAIRIRNREWGATLNETCPDAKYLRDAIIANRKTK